MLCHFSVISCLIFYLVREDWNTFKNVIIIDINHNVFSDPVRHAEFLFDYVSKLCSVQTASYTHTRLASFRALAIFSLRAAMLDLTVWPRVMIFSASVCSVSRRDLMLGTKPWTDFTENKHKNKYSKLRL